MIFGKQVIGPAMHGLLGQVDYGEAMRVDE